MSPNQNSKQPTAQKLDECANRLADISREIRDLRDQVAELASQESLEAREVNARDLLARIAGLEREHAAQFPVIQGEIDQLVSLHSLRDAAHKEFLLVIEGKVRLTLHRFLRIPTTRNVDGSNFRGWLRILIKNGIIDYKRSACGASEKLNRRLAKDWEEKHGKPYDIDAASSGDVLDRTGHDKRRAVSQPDRPVRHVPKRFSAEEEQDIESLPQQCQVLFLFSTGLWHHLSGSKQKQWPDAQASSFEITRLTAIARANRFVMGTVEDELASRPVDWQTDHDVLFQELVRKKAGVVAQTLNRYYWRFMQLDTVWQHLFRFIDPLDQALVEQIEATLDPDLMLAYVHCDVYFRCDTATRCFDWLERCSFENSIHNNLGRVAGQRAFISVTPTSSQLRTNQKKWQYACQLAGQDPSHTEANEFVTTIFTERDGPHGRSLPLSVASRRHCVDLPLAFERMPEAQLQEDYYEADDE